MSIWMLGGVASASLGFGLVLFILLITRAPLLFRRLSPDRSGDGSHIYPVYSNMRLIRLVDYQPIISAILLFQYHRLVSAIVSGLENLDLKDKKVLITSCAFGNIIPRVVTTAARAGAERVLIADLVGNELVHARRKLADLPHRVDFIKEDAADMKHDDGTVDANVMFFLLHELPHPSKIRALNEAARLLRPGGKLFLAEFHRPDLGILRAMSWLYFKVFEPFGLALWDTHDPLRCLESLGGWACERRTYLFGNFQLVIATKLPHDVASLPQTG